MVIKKSALKALDLMTTNDVAKELDVTIRTVQLWVEQGALEGWKTPGGHRRITRSSFNKFVLGNAAAKKSPVDESRLKVVIVEDDQAMQMLYRMTIDSWKMPIDTKFIANGYEGIVHISQHTPDLLITDLIMPEMDGFSMLKALRKLDNFSQMAIIVVTGIPLYEVEDKGGLPEGIKLYGKSPVPFAEIRALMQSLINEKRERLTT